MKELDEIEQEVRREAEQDTARFTVTPPPRAAVTVFACG